MTFARTADWLRERMWFGLAVGAVPWVVWLGSLAVGGWYKDAEGTLVGCDHLAFFTAAHFVRTGEQPRMYDYDYDRLRAVQSSLIGWDWHGIEGYRNPPFYALLYLPTLGLGFYASFLVWTAIGFGLLAVSILLLKPERPRRALAWALAFYPVFATVSFGQNTLLSLAVFAAVYRLADGGRLFAAGFVAGLLWFKPQLLLGLFVWWGLAPRRHLLCWVGVGVTGLVLAAVSWLALPEASQAFVDTLGANMSYAGFGLWNVHNPKTFFALLMPDWPAVYWGLALVVAAASVGVAWWVARRTGAPVAVMFPVAVFLTLWASPHALIYEWALLLAAGVVLWERFPASRGVWLCLFALAWAGLLVSTPLALVQIRYLQLPVVLQVSIPALGFVGWWAARELARSREAQA